MEDYAIIYLGYTLLKMVKNFVIVSCISQNFVGICHVLDKQSSVSFFSLFNVIPLQAAYFTTVQYSILFLPDHNLKTGFYAEKGLFPTK